MKTSQLPGAGENFLDFRRPGNCSWQPLIALNYLLFLIGIPDRKHEARQSPCGRLSGPACELDLPGPPWRQPIWQWELHSARGGERIGRGLGRGWHGGGGGRVGGAVQPPLFPE